MTKEAREAMTDEEAELEAFRKSGVAGLDAFAAGFRAGLAHARQWRPLTADPASWPEEGRVVRWWRSDTRAELVGFLEHDAYGHWVTYGTPDNPGPNLRLLKLVTHWLPLPDPPEVTP